MWRDLGIEHVGLILHKVEAAGWERSTDLIRDAGVRVSTIAGPVPVPLDVDASSEARVAEQAAIARAIDFAVDVRAESMYLCSGSAGSLSWEGAAVEFAERAPWMALFPGIAISLAVFAFNVFGDSLRDALDPKLRLP